MDTNIFSLNEPDTFSINNESDNISNLLKKYQDYQLIDEQDIQEEVIDIDENMEVVQEEEMDPAGSEPLEEVNSEIYQETDVLTNQVFKDGVNDLMAAIDPYSVHEDVLYQDNGVVFNLRNGLPDYAVTFDCNGVEVVFPTSYAEDIIIQDGMLLNLGSNYTAGLQISGYSVSNYLSSELTIPTYHSSTWYQYLQTYGQPYRIVDRYVNNYGGISSATRESVDIEWSGGNPWQGFTFDRAAMLIVIIVLFVMLIFRKGR